VETYTEVPVRLSEEQHQPETHAYNAHTALQLCGCEYSSRAYSPEAQGCAHAKAAPETEEERTASQEGSFFS